MDHLAWRAEYGAGMNHTIEWFIATNYGVAHFKFLTKLDDKGNLTGVRVETNSEMRSFGYLREQGVKLRRHPIFLRANKRLSQLGVRFFQYECATLDELEEKFRIGTIVQGDPKAANVWANLTGRPVGQTFESVIAEAEQKTAEIRQAKMVERAKVLSTVDSEWGMF